MRLGRITPIFLLIFLFCCYTMYTNYSFMQANSETVGSGYEELYGEGDTFSFSFMGTKDLWHEIKIIQTADYDFYGSGYIVKGKIGPLARGDKISKEQINSYTIIHQSIKDKFDYSITYDSEGDESEHFTTKKYRFNPGEKGDMSFIFTLDSEAAEFNWDLMVMFVEPEEYDAAENKMILGIVGMILSIFFIIFSFIYTNKDDFD